MRKCKKCGELKPLEKFKKHSECEEGRMKTCRKCINNKDRKRRKQKRLKELKEEYRKIKERIKRYNRFDLNYLAGIIDGEGCIAIYQRERKNKYQTMPMIDARVVVGTMDNVLTKLCKDILDIGSISKKKTGANEWIACNKNAYIVCKTFYPFLRLKKEQAKCVIDLYEKMKYLHFKNGNNTVVDKLIIKEEIIRRKILVDRIKQLKYAKNIE